MKWEMFLEHENMMYFDSETKKNISGPFQKLRILPAILVREEPPLLGRVHVRPQGPFGVSRSLSLQRSQLDLVQTKLKTRTLFVQGNVLTVNLK